MKGSILVVILMMLSAPAYALDSYLCVPDMATGFIFDRTSQKWHPAQFNVSGKKYLLKRVAKGAVWNKFGSSDSADHCTDFNEGGYTFCTGLSNVTFNEKNLRYQLIYPIGYMSGGIAGPMNDLISALGDTPFIEIGTCSVL
jgi:hypothetical protein